MKRLSLQFTEPYRVTVLEEPVARSGDHQVLVKTICSAISTGTELLIYRGQWPDDVPVDETIPALAGRFRFPLKYGYSAVGRVTDIGSGINPEWLGKLVFAFNPHESLFVASPDQLLPLPSSISPEEGVLLPNMETAVSFVMDGRPLIGEQVVVFGQGVVGLLTTALLARIPLARLITLDSYPLRREKSSSLGADPCMDPTDPGSAERLRALLGESEPGGGADLIYELSGNPAALDLAIACTGFSGRVVIGSWYGAKRVDLDLGGHFHRGRIKLISSQVSRIAPEFSGLWTKSRRLGVALRMLEHCRPANLITHRFPISRAQEAYNLLDKQPEQVVGVILTYEDLS